MAGTYYAVVNHKEEEIGVFRYTGPQGYDDAEDRAKALNIEHPTAQVIDAKHLPPFVQRVPLTPSGHRYSVELCPRTPARLPPLHIPGEVKFDLMLDISCPICGAEYVVFQDAEEHTWRFICRCESSSRCKACKSPATQARVTEEGRVDKFACDQHGVPIDLRPTREEENKPVGEQAPQKAKAKAPSRIKEDKPQHDVLTLEGFKAEIVERKLSGRCLKCRKERNLIDSVFRPVEGSPIYDLVCPHCGHDRHESTTR